MWEGVELDLKKYDRTNTHIRDDVNKYRVEDKISSGTKTYLFMRCGCAKRN